MNKSTSRKFSSTVSMSLQDEILKLLQQFHQQLLQLSSIIEKNAENFRPRIVTDLMRKYYIGAANLTLVLY